MTEHEDRIRIELPAEAEAVGSARLFATSVARMFAVEDEVVEDIRLAVSEGVTARVHAAPDPSPPVSVTVTVRSKDLVFEISGAGSPIDDGEVGVAVIQSLFPDAAVERDPYVLRFIAPRGTAG